MAGFGEAATAFVAGWRGLGEVQVAVYDIKTDAASDTVRRDKWADYDRWGIDGRATMAKAVGGADLVFSAVTPDQAVIAATTAAPHLAPRTLYLDCNSCAPGAKRAAADIVETAGARYVDIAVMAPVHPALHKTPMLISGPHTDETIAALGKLAMNPQPVEGGIGAAAAIKMIRSVMMKGLEALVLECVLAGRKAGVADTVLASLDASYPGFDWRKRAAYMLERVATHGVRRAGEMTEAARTVDELGLGGAMSLAASDWQRRVGKLGLTAADIGEKDYEKLADAILERLPLVPDGSDRTTERK